MGFSDIMKVLSPAYGIYDALAGDGDKSRAEGLAVPNWWEDPMYASTQGKLNTVGTGLLDGNVPDYYKGIGEAGGADFEKFLGLTNADAQRSAEESLAKSGRLRGGNAAAVTSQAVADNSIKARYADFQRSLEGKKFLFGEGRGITEGVRGSAQVNQQNRNAFNLDTYDRTFAADKYLDSYDREGSQDLGKTLGTIGGGALGFMAGGPAGAMAGAGIGGSLFGGGSSSPSTSWMDAFAPKAAGSTTAASGSSAAAGVSSLGSIGDDELAQLLRNLHT